MVSPQVAKFGDIDISELATKHFKLPDGNSFVIKNEGLAAVTLEVLPALSETGDFVSCVFDVGWNPELVREIKAASLTNVSIKWGY